MTVFTDTLNVRRKSSVTYNSLLRLVIGLTVLFGSASSVFTSETHWTYRIDWEDATLYLEGEREISGHNVSAYTHTSRIMSREAPHAWLDALRSIQIDSIRRINDELSDNPELVTMLVERFDNARSLGSSPSRAIDVVRQTWSIPLHSTITRLFLNHTVPRPLPRPVAWQPRQTYTGLFIDARGTLAVRGSSSTAQTQPVILPRLYDDEMDIVVSAEMVDAAYLSRWGVAGYTTVSDPEMHRDRIGENPLFVAADALFGVIPANIVIPRDSAEILLVHPSNHRILNEGRIVILVDRL